MIARFLKLCLECNHLYTHTNSTIEEQKDLLTTFAGVFTVLEPYNFRDIFSNGILNDSGTNIDALQLIYDHILMNPLMISIPQQFLANENSTLTTTRNIPKNLKTFQKQWISLTFLLVNFFFFFFLCFTKWFIFFLSSTFVSFFIFFFLKGSHVFASILLEFLLKKERMAQLSVPSDFMSCTTLQPYTYYNTFEMSLILNKSDLHQISLLSSKNIKTKTRTEQQDKKNVQVLSPLNRSNILLRLFKMTFGSVTLFEKNEPVLLPQLCNIISICMRNILASQYPERYLLLLRR